MAMKLSRATDRTIMRIGRWTSLTYLTYSHTQIGALSAGVAWKMSQCFTLQPSVLVLLGMMHACSQAYATRLVEMSAGTHMVATRAC